MDEEYAPVLRKKRGGISIKKIVDVLCRFLAWLILILVVSILIIFNHAVVNLYVLWVPNWLTLCMKLALLLADAFVVLVILDSLDDEGSTVYFALNILLGERLAIQISKKLTNKDKRKRIEKS